MAIVLENPVEVTEPEKVIGSVVRYQIGGFSFIDQPGMSYAQVVINGYDADDKIVQTIPHTISAGVISGSPEYTAVHAQVRDMLEGYLISEGVIPGS